MFDHVLLKHKEKPVVTANRQSKKSFSPVSTHRCDDTKAEKIRLLATKMATGGILPVSFAETEGFWDMKVFFEPVYESPSEG